MGSSVSIIYHKIQLVVFIIILVSDFLVIPAKNFDSSACKVILYQSAAAVHANFVLGVRSVPTGLLFLVNDIRGAVHKNKVADCSI